MFKQYGKVKLWLANHKINCLVRQGGKHMAKFSSLKEKIKELNTSGVGFMEGREKGELPKGEKVTLDDYGFIKGESGDEYVVLSLMEYPKHFFFGGSVVTSKIQELDVTLDDAEKAAIKEDGIPVLFEQKAAKKGKRTYTSITFFPGEEEF